MMLSTEFSLFPMPPNPASALRKGLDLLLPPSCASCGAPAGQAQALCPDCWGGLHFITAPYCACCGLPFEFPAAFADARCAACLADPPLFAAARAALSYNEGSKGLILPFKNSDRTDFAPLFARMMAQAGRELLDKSDVLVPVPLHWRRLFARRYNQAGLLALLLGRGAKKPVRLRGLVRRKPTPAQGHLPRRLRARNVAGAFAAPKGETAHMEGRAVLLVDDVLTTGATANACARALLQAGAKEVNVLALARVRKEGM